MPKLMVKMNIDEKRLVELIKMRPELYDPSNEHSKDNNRKKIAWNEISMELNASVDQVKRVWRKLKLNCDKRFKIEEIRKSGGLNLVERSLDLLADVGINANGNSQSSAIATIVNTSENCESPKRVLRSGLQLSTITETELTSLSSSFDSNKTPTTVFRDNAHQESTINGTNDQTNQKHISDSCKTANNVQQNNNQQSQVTVDKSDRTLRPRQLAMLSVATKENNSPLRSPKTIPTKIKNKQKKIINFHGATRAFFDSMAMTVSTFPPQYQASIKMEICNIVAETEYKLSLKQKN